MNLKDDTSQTTTPKKTIELLNLTVDLLVLVNSAIKTKQYPIAEELTEELLDTLKEEMDLISVSQNTTEK